MAKIVVFTVESSVAIAINAFILVLILKSSKLRKATSNIFLINLIVADLVAASMALVVCLGHYAQKAKRKEWKEENAIELFMFVFTSTLITLLVAVILVTIDRFVAVVTPFRYQELFTRRKITILLATIWAIGGVILLAGLVCATLDDSKTLEVAKSVLDIVLITISSAGVVFLIIANTVILRAIRKQLKLESTVSVFGNDTVAAKKSETNLRKKEIRAVYLCFSIVALFTICWLPITVALVLDRSVNSSNSGRTFMELGKTLVFIGIALNPCLYVPFKAELRHFFCKCFRGGRTANKEMSLSIKKTIDQSTGKMPEHFLASEQAI